MRVGLRGIALLGSLCLGLGGCGTKPSPPSVLLALDGPPLSIAAELGARPFKGYMERHCMAGVGHIVLYLPDSKAICQGNMDSPPTEKARLYAELSCSDSRTLRIAMRNLGPDQGLGIGSFEGQEETLILFYHPCEDEAKRRLAVLRSDIEQAKKNARPKEAPKDITPEQAPPPTDI